MQLPKARVSATKPVPIQRDCLPDDNYNRKGIRKPHGPFTPLGVIPLKFHMPEKVVFN